MSLFRNRARFIFPNLALLFLTTLFVQTGLGMDPTNKMDFVGDGRADLAIYREGCDRVSIPEPSCAYAPSYFWVYNLETGTWGVYPYGQSLDFPIPADYNGDGKTDYAVYRWFRATETPNDTNAWFAVGSPTNFFGNLYGRKAPRNFIGPSPDPTPTAEVAEHRRELVDKDNLRFSYTFYYQAGQSFVATNTGGDTPTYRSRQFAVPQDYLNNDKISEVAVLELRRDATTQVAISACYRVWSSPTSEVTSTPGMCLDANVNYPAPGDYDGNGLADYGGVIRNGSGLTWKIKHNGNPLASDISEVFGPAGATPVPADYTNDGKTDLAYVYEASGLLYWVIRPSEGGSDITVQWGVKTDTVLSQPFFSDPWY